MYGGLALKHRPTTALRFALTGIAAACACLWTSPTWALGLGRLTVQSALGETLKAEVDVTSITAEEAATLRLRVASPEAYRAAGVDYNAALSSAQVQTVRRPDGRTVLRITGDRAVTEPFVDVIIEATWATGRLVREYTLLLDPPGARAAAVPGPPAVAPVITPAPSPSLPSAPAPAPAPGAEPSVAPPLPATTSPAPRATSRAPVPAPATAASGDEYRVRSGDTLSRIAARVQRPGVSLDQMLVSLYRANPDAFMGQNMNRLRTGVVLAVPSAETTGQVTPREAREVIQAQSADFASYRQRLAGATTATAEEAPARQAGGQVQTRVDDRRQAAASSPDKLRLSQGAARAGTPESRVSAEAERRAASAREAELARNVAELSRLRQSVTPGGAQVAAAPTTTQPTPAAPPPAPTAPSPPPAAPAPGPAASAPAPMTVTTPVATPSVPTPAASAPAEAASAAAPAVTAPASAAPPPPAAPAPPPVKPAAPEPGFVDSLLENPMVLPGAGVLVALLAGLGIYRLRKGGRKSGNETSFLESRLQPDSFFGASGGQRIDTREASSSTSSSSMSYSLSQLDAIGDVDPVAEADVYLAYGRDLQAEEILKEAMRANPDRMAIRTKLLEVYAKRRDAKGFELLATQLHSLTRGEGEDWAKAQALGQTVDPDNTLYHPGGQPDAVLGASGLPVEPLGASTMPYSAPVSPPAFRPASDAATLEGDAEDSGMDLDLDISGPGDFQEAPITPMERTAPIATGASLSGPSGIDFPLDTGEGALDEPNSRNLDFDVSGFTLDVPPTSPAPTPATALAAQQATTIALPPIGGGNGGEGDPLSRKLELAEEFRQIGDTEGARDLLEEVMAKADGALRTKAKAMLDALA
ncbi:MAG: FimV family protein [Burkholderiales bacterium]|nr:FimV family protein [Burkholderiales bacterium]